MTLRAGVANGSARSTPAAGGRNDFNKAWQKHLALTSSRLLTLLTFAAGSRAECRSGGRTRELAGDEPHGAADMDAFKELEAPIPLFDCGERAVSVEPIFHPDWRGCVIDHPLAE